MTKIEKLSITDLPATTIDLACDKIASYTVAMNRMISRSGIPESQLVGTGTLVKVEGLDCILTADHVLEEFREPDKMGLMSSFTGRPSGHEFPLSDLGLHRIARGDTDETGPDIALVVLPQQSIAALRSEKVFYNINKHAKCFDNSYLPLDYGFWLNCGIVGETERELPPDRNIVSLKGYEGLCGASANPKESFDGVFDYLEVRIDLEGRADLPSTFGGMSGGGLWQVLMRKTSEGKIEPEDWILSGVTFYESEVERDKRHLRCHGRKSIYERVPEYVRDNIKCA